MGKQMTEMLKITIGSAERMYTGKRYHLAPTPAERQRHGDFMAAMQNLSDMQNSKPDIRIQLPGGAMPPYQGWPFIPFIT
jgi:hypothetical protein